MAIIITSEEEYKHFLETLAEEERIAKEDNVRKACINHMDADKIYRSTLWKVEHHQDERLLVLGDWIIDPDGGGEDILDIVHICDSDRFYSPTVFVLNSSKADPRHAHKIHKYAVEYKAGDLTLVCVTCGSKPKEDVLVTLELLLAREENIRAAIEDVPF